jgi:hypothetical protein
VATQVGGIQLKGFVAHVAEVQGIGHGRRNLETSFEIGDDHFGSGAIAEDRYEGQGGTVCIYHAAAQLCVGGNGEEPKAGKQAGFEPVREVEFHSF